MKHRNDRLQSCDDRAPGSPRAFWCSPNPREHSRFALPALPHQFSCLTTSVREPRVGMASPIRGSARESRGKPGLAKHLQQGVFPGRISPGLIEARGTGRDRPTGGSDFPGESARASLKRNGRAHGAAGAGDFPGESARASLKHVGRELDSMAREGFPGETARASLKLGHGGLEPTDPRVFPGRVSPGLIESPATGIRALSMATENRDTSGHRKPDTLGPAFRAWRR